LCLKTYFIKNRNDSALSGRFIKAQGWGVKSGLILLVFFHTIFIQFLIQEGGQAG